MKSCIVFLVFLVSVTLVAGRCYPPYPSCPSPKPDCFCPEIYQPPFNVPTAGAQAFLMDGIRRLGYVPTRGPSADWRVLTNADATGTNGLTCLRKHGGAQDSKFLVTRPMTDHCESFLTSTIAAERANNLHHRAPFYVKRVTDKHNQYKQ
ncbi:hypothetical protein evm_009426 [Chilo suppressalis]|nr:hypothetical protein evm_009426 [Chilo suppressalis]